MSFINCQDKSTLVLKVDASTAMVSIHCESLQTISQLIQDLAEYMNIKEL
jgi:hypothetical protein